VIWESMYWKDDLLRQAKALRKRISQRRWTERSLARLDQTIMLGFYSIRKLTEAQKLSDEVKNHQITLRAYPCKEKPVTLMNWHKVDKLYDFERESRVMLGLLSLCHLMIHSYVFIPSFKEQSQIEGVFVNSDRTRNKELYFIPLSTIIRLFSLVGSDYPSKMSGKFNQAKGEWELMLSK